MKRLLLVGFLLVSTLAFAQPANDNCSGAINLGTLGAPGACGSGIKNGATTTLATTNVASTPENPYVVLGGCGMASPANSVWYRFTAPTNGFAVNISITGATFANPNIALYSGANCNSLVGVGCIVGTGGAATLNVNNGIVPGQRYYIMVSGNTGQTGTFTLQANAYQDCADCLNASSLTVSPLPVNGTYQPGQTVSFCYHISQWTQTVNNWLHGVQMSFGSGWNLASLTTTPPPPFLLNITYWGFGVTPNTCGNWQYYPAGITSTASGASWPPGFYFNGTYDLNTGVCISDADGNPGNNFGDGVGCSGCVVTPGAGDWNFCWSIQVATGCNPGMSLNVAVNTSGDGESGSWVNVGCANDPPTTFSAIISCCPPTTSSTSTCSNLSTGTATATPVGSASPYVYAWAPGGQSTQTATGLIPGTYTVTVTDVNLCAASATVTVGSYALPTATAITNISQCVGSTISVPAFVGNPVGSTFTWTNSNTAIGLAASGTGNIPSFTATNATASPITSTISFTPTSPAPGLCVGTTYSFTITVNPIPVTTVNSPTICAGQTATLTANGATTYTWSAGATANGVNIATISPVAPTSYTVTGISSGCSSTAVSNVSINPLPTVTVTGGGEVCQGVTAPSVILNFTGAGPWNFTLSNGITNTALSTSISPYVLNNPPAGTYTVVLISDVNCTGISSGSAVVIIDPLPIASFIAPPSGCVPVCGSFINTSSISSGVITGWAWSVSNGVTSTQTSPTICLTTTGTYTITLTATSEAGCTSTNTNNTGIINVHAKPEASFTVNTPISVANPTAQVTDYSTGATSWNWNFGDAYSPASTNTSILENPSHYYPQLGNYCISLIVSNGYCIDSAEVCFEIGPEFEFYIPNAFSPNGDGTNDDFFGKGIGIVEYQMDIWDRWGMHIFHCNDINDHWDGRLKGDLVQEDVYVYVVVLKDVFGEPHRYMGTVTVVR